MRVKYPINTNLLEYRKNRELYMINTNIREFYVNNKLNRKYTPIYLFGKRFK